MIKYWKYLKYVLRHKWFVFLYCLKYGLIWRGIVHDLSKFRPSEFIPYARNFYGSYPDELSVPMLDVGYSGPFKSDIVAAFMVAWNHHQKRNDHHWQYWMLTWDRGNTELLPMPDKCRKEMIADWKGAGRALGKPDTMEWYLKNRLNIQLHPETRAWVELELGVPVQPEPATAKPRGLSEDPDIWWLKEQGL